MYELPRMALLSVLARAAAATRAQAQTELIDHDRAIVENRARALETALVRTRNYGESYNLVDGHIINLINKAGIRL